MGLDFMVAAIAWPDRCAPDWDALLAAAADLPLELADRVDEIHQLWELGAVEPDERREYASGEVMTGINYLRARFVRGGLHLTVVQPDGWTVLLDGGVSPGEEPTQTWYATEALAVSGLLGESLIRDTDAPAPPPPSLPRSRRLLIDELTPISELPRLVVAAFPPVLDWERARTVSSERERQWLDRLEAVLAGSYSRTSATLRLATTTLFLGDRADPTGAAAAIAAWDASGALEALGARVLHDIRLQDQPQPTTGEST
jgi:hypothetical protein